MPGAQLLAGCVAVVLTIALHLLLTRTFVGSRLLAVAEDRNAAMLMGIRPDRMQALAWGLAAASAGIAGALMAMSYPWSPSVGETFGLTAFVVVTPSVSHTAHPTDCPHAEKKMRPPTRVSSTGLLKPNEFIGATSVTVAPTATRMRALPSPETTRT